VARQGRCPSAQAAGRGPARGARGRRASAGAPLSGARGAAQAGSPGLAKHGPGALEARADSVSLLERGGSAFSVESDFLPEQRRSGLQARGTPGRRAPGPRPSYTRSPPGSAPARARCTGAAQLLQGRGLGGRAGRGDAAPARRARGKSRRRAVARRAEEWGGRCGA